MNIHNFALSIVAPEPGCEYIYGPNPAWDDLPIGQTCKTSPSPLLIIGITVLIITLIAVALYLYRKKSKSAKK